MKATPPTPAEIEKARKDAVDATSIPKSAATWWGGLSAADQASWKTRGTAAIAAVVKYATAHHPELGISAANFNLDFPGVEARGANVVAAGSPAQVGKAFVISVELNPAYVMDVVVHEVFGHPEYGVYGTEYHLAIYDRASAKILGYVKPAAGVRTHDRTRRVCLSGDRDLRRSAQHVVSLPDQGRRPVGAEPRYPGTGHMARRLDEEAMGADSHRRDPSGAPQTICDRSRISAAALIVFDKAVEANFDAKTRAVVAA